MICGLAMPVINVPRGAITQLQPVIRLILAPRDVPAPRRQAGYGSAGTDAVLHRYTHFPLE